jgi:hypothetical protein
MCDWGVFSEKVVASGAVHRPRPGFEPVTVSSFANNLLGIKCVERRVTLSLHEFII